ncbi:MAG: hypothetical protein LBT24_04315 [Tannerella sp.]|jgi:hypothetical protein|nr:hypothetical protein [Tannerella sp.]
MNVPVVIDNVFNGAGTVFRVWNDIEAFPGTDYNLSGGNITFLKVGTYSVEISNPAITSHTWYPAKVIATYNVSSSPDGIEYVEQEKLSISSENGILWVRVENGVIESIRVYSFMGIKLYDDDISASSKKIPLPKGPVILQTKTGNTWRFTKAFIK